MEFEKVVEAALAKLKLEEKLNDVLKCLEEAGVDRPEDLPFVTVEDLLQALKPVKARALISSWLSKGDSTCTPTEEVTSQDPPKVLTPVKLATNTVNNSPSGQSATWPHTVELRFDDIEDKPKGVRRGVLKVMKQNGKLTPQERRAVVRHIINKVHLVHPRPYRVHLDIVARKAVEILPCLKDADLANTSIGRGYDSLLNQLENRAESERRGQYRPTKRALNSDDEEDAAEKNKTPKKTPYGQLNGLADAPDEQSGPDFIYYQQRLMIVEQGASAAEVLDKWPELFSIEGIDQHFSKLMGIKCTEKLMQSFLEKSDIIVNCFEAEAKISKSDRLKKLKGRLRAAKKASEELQNRLPYLPVTVTLILWYFKEDRDILFRVADDPTEVAEVTKDLPTTPCIIAIGSSLYKASSFLVAVDGVVVSKDISCFVQAMAVMFAAYFIFNIQYPSDAGFTLEFIQRFFMEIDPCKGSKIAKGLKKKKTSSISPKVLSLYNFLKERAEEQDQEN